MDRLPSIFFSFSTGGKEKFGASVMKTSSICISWRKRSGEGNAVFRKKRDQDFCTLLGGVLGSFSLI